MRVRSGLAGVLAAGLLVALGVPGVAAAAPTTVPTAPTLTSATPTNGKIALVWTAPSSANQSGYNIYCAAGAAAPVTPGTPTDTAGSGATSRTESGLTNGQQYTCVITATNSLGESPASNSLSATPFTVPGKPTLNSATAGQDSLTLAWTAPASDGGSGLTGYDLYCAPGSTSPATTGTPTATAGAADVNGTVTGLTPETQYTCVITAVNVAGQSSASGNKSATPYDVSLAPQLTSVTGGNHQVILTWTAPSDNGGSNLTGYDLFCAAGTSAPDTSGMPNQTVGNSVTSHNVNGLTNATPYTCAVTAVNAAGQSPASNSLSATPFTVPDNPSLTSATAGQDSITLAWTAPASDGGSSLTGYDLYCAPGSTSPATTGTPTATAGAADVNGTVTGLTPETQYTCVITAVNVAGQSSASGNKSATPYDVSLAPQLTSVTGGNHQVILTWTAPSDNGGSNLTGYDLFCAAGTSAPDTSGMPNQTVGNSVTSHNVNGLTNATPYTCAVTAVNAAGQSPASNALSATPFTVPGAPSLTSATADNESIDLAWTAPTSDGGSDLAGYNLFCAAGTSAPDTSVTPDQTVGLGATTGTVNGLTAETEYTCVVTATNLAGQSNASNALSATPYTVPDAPVLTSATAGDESITLDWTPGDDGGDAITSYNLYCAVGTPDTNGPANGTAGPTDTSGTLTALTPETHYTCVVTAVNDAGPSDPSNTESATPYTVPGAPILTSATAGGESIDLVWTAPTDDGGSAIIEYQLFCAEGTSAPATSGFPTSTVDPTETTATVDGLTAGTEYTCVVVALNAAGQSDASNTDSATPFTVPSAPGLTSATAGDSSIALVWTPSTDDGGDPISAYFLYCAPGTSAPDTSGPPDQEADPTDTTGTVNGLTNGTEYTCVVTAYNDAGQSDASSTESATPFTVPDAPGLTSAAAGAGSITLVWTAPGDDGGSDITGYNLFCAAGTSAPDTSGTPNQIAGPGSTSGTVSGLTAETEYTCAVTVANIAGQSLASNTESATPYEVPDEPGLTSATAGAGSIALVWTAPGDDGGSPVTGYNLFCAPGTSTPSTSGTPTGTAGAGATSKSVTGLTSGTEYTCVVTAVNAAGQSDASNAESATPTAPTSPPPPPPPGGPVVTVNVTSSTANPSVYGQPVSFVADLTGAGNGQVQWSIDGTPSGGPETPSTAAAAAKNGRGVRTAGDPEVTLGPISTLTVGSHVVMASFTPAGGGAATSASVTQVVKQAATATTVNVTGSTITATVTPVAPGAGTPTGTVTFSVGGAGAGSAPVGADGKATLTDSAVGSQVVTAAYGGDVNFTASSGTSVTNPTITSHVTSAHAKHHGWYRSSVHVTFTCTVGSAPLAAACPGPVTLSSNGSGQSLTRTVNAADGGVASVVVSKINIDKSKPTVHVKGVTSGKTYAEAPHLKCVAHDALSGVASCVITKHHHKQNGVLTVHYTVTATDVAGNEHVIHGLYRVS